MILLQANEVPWELLSWASLEGLTPAIDRFCSQGTAATTTPAEDSDRYLYPSQTWASFSTGSTFSEHGSYWYHDVPRNTERLFWNRAMAAGKTVGLAGVLHSAQKGNPDPRLKFYVPDSFSDEETIPESLRGFHRASRSLTDRSGRKVTGRLSAADAVGLSSSLRHGLRPRSALHVAEIAASAVVGRRSFERARIGQHVVMSDIFLRLLRSDTPDLAVYFTNHVASMMHRYWYAVFPSQFEHELFDETWRRRGAEALAEAVVELDRLVARVMEFAADHDRPVGLASSMGQQANSTLTAPMDTTVLLRDASLLSTVLGLDPDSVRAAMVPQVTWSLASVEAADKALIDLRERTTDGFALEFESQGEMLTLTYRLSGRSVLPFDRGVPLENSGFVHEKVDDAGTGIHHPQGIFGLWNTSIELPDELPLERCAESVLSALDPSCFPEDLGIGDLVQG